MGIAQIILLIMSLIGALPEFIAALEKLWTWIKSVRDPKQRRAFKREWVNVAMHGVDQKKPQPRTAQVFAQAVSQLDSLQNRVMGELARQLQNDQLETQKLHKFHGMMAAEDEGNTGYDSCMSIGSRGGVQGIDKPQTRG